MWNLFQKKPCPVCQEKDRLILQLREDLSRDRLRLSLAMDRESLAVDRLLQKQGDKGITPPQRVGVLEADAMMKDTFAIFVDQEDKGDGKVREVDCLDHDRPTTR